MAVTSEGTTDRKDLHQWCIVIVLLVLLGKIRIDVFVNAFHADIDGKYQLFSTTREPFPEFSVHRLATREASVIVRQIRLTESYLS